MLCANFSAFVLRICYLLVRRCFSSQKTISCSQAMATNTGNTMHSKNAKISSGSVSPAMHDQSCVRHALCWPLACCMQLSFQTMHKDVRLDETTCCKIFHYPKIRPQVLRKHVRCSSGEHCRALLLALLLQLPLQILLPLFLLLVGGRQAACRKDKN